MFGSGQEVRGRAGGFICYTKLGRYHSRWWFELKKQWMYSAWWLVNGSIKEKKNKTIINIDLAVVASQWLEVAVYNNYLE